jgi:adenine C2-methylase RlmN of 23S rRNA A2503 and tRNA A37
MVVALALRIVVVVQEAPYVNLALSLHAPNQELRQKIVPSAQAFPLPKLMAALDDHLASVQRKVLIEYVVVSARGGGGGGGGCCLSGIG